MMSYYDNPAGRLLANFQQARKFGGDVPAVTAWSRVFNVEESNEHAFMVRVAKLFEFADRTHELMLDLPGAVPSIHLKHFGEIRSALAFFYRVRDLNIQQFLSPISEKSGEYCLEICSHMLHAQRVEPAIKAEDRDSLVEKLDDLVESVKADESLDSDTAAWLLNRLAEVRDTLVNPQMFDIEDTEYAVDKLFGGVRRKLRFLQSLTRSDVGTKLMAFIVAIDLLINLSANTNQLTSGKPPAPSPIVIEIQNEIAPGTLLPELPEKGSEDGK